VFALIAREHQECGLALRRTRPKSSMPSATAREFQRAAGGIRVRADRSISSPHVLISVSATQLTELTIQCFQNGEVL
jgi:hypothetical protein